ncbi:hypothetical protein [Tenacibaculum agarivorans]|uniref:hypothetical protein n=1 Tax=Tenacibaculum agarivorans TaxID=1908389 RepID=UPI00094BB2D4|nr:hypothetical protein [Tenacibaculum agarivorans]
MAYTVRKLSENAKESLEYIKKFIWKKGTASRAIDHALSVFLIHRRMIDDLRKQVDERDKKIRKLKNEYEKLITAIDIVNNPKDIKQILRKKP